MSPACIWANIWPWDIVVGDEDDTVVPLDDVVELEEELVVLDDGVDCVFVLVGDNVELEEELLLLDDDVVCVVLGDGVVELVDVVELCVELNVLVLLDDVVVFVVGGVELCVPLDDVVELVLAISFSTTWGGELLVWICG